MFQNKGRIANKNRSISMMDSYHNNKDDFAGVSSKKTIHDNSIDINDYTSAKNLLNKRGSIDFYSLDKFSTNLLN